MSDFNKILIFQLYKTHIHFLQQMFEEYCISGSSYIQLIGW